MTQQVAFCSVPGNADLLPRKQTSSFIAAISAHGNVRQYHHPGMHKERLANCFYCLTSIAEAVGRSADSARAAQSSSAEGAHRDGQGPVAPIDYNGIAGRMEVIMPEDVSLVKYLGSGGYGEVYLGKWHSSEAAIKCLNPSLFFNAGQVKAFQRA